jgi:hypothetical protein
MDRKDKIKKRLQKKLKEEKKELLEKQLKESKELPRSEIKGETKVEAVPRAESKLPTQDNTKIFQAINEFIGDITSIYGELLTELKAYDLLLSKTTLKHKKAIENHVSIFRNYCKLNEKVIISKDETKIENIKYNEKISIDIKHIFSIATTTDKVSIWNHLLTLLYYTNPSVELKATILNKSKKGEDDNESKFLENMVDKLQNNLSEESMSNPMSAMMSLFSSGVIGDLMSSAQQGQNSGQLNIKKLLGTVNKLVENLSEDESGNIDDVKDMLKNVKM